MKRDATIDNKKAYDSKPANFHIDEESEKIAYEKGMRKLAKKKQGTNQALGKINSNLSGRIRIN